MPCFCICPFSSAWIQNYFCFTGKHELELVRDLTLIINSMWTWTWLMFSLASVSFCILNPEIATTTVDALWTCRGRLMIMPNTEKIASSLLLRLFSEHVSIQPAHSVPSLTACTSFSVRNHFLIWSISIIPIKFSRMFKLITLNCRIQLYRLIAQ